MEEQLQPITVKNEASSLSIKEIFYKYVRFLPLLALSVALCLFTAYIYLRYAQEVYTATGAISIQDDKAHKQGDQRFDELFSAGGTKNIPSEIEYIKSRPIMERVVRALNLNYSYYAKGRFKDLNIYKISPFHLEAIKIYDSSASFLLNLKFDNERTFRVNNEKTAFTFGQVFQNASGVFRLVRHSYGDIYKEYNIFWQPTVAVANQLDGSLVVAPKTAGTGIITLYLEATSPILTADVINQLMKEYQTATIEDKNVTTQQTIAFIDGRLQIVSNELDSITNSLLRYQKNNNLINPEAQSADFFTRLTETDKALNEQRIQINLAHDIADYLSNRDNIFTIVPSSLGIGDATLNTLIAAYNVAQLQRKQLIDGNVPRGNVAVQQKEDEIRKLRTSILESLRNLQTAYSASINNLQRQNSQAQSELRSLPEKQQNLIEIQRQQTSKQEMYNFLMGKREESAISLAATISDTKVLEEATPNPIPIKPKRWNIQLMAIAIGLAIPALIIFLIEILNDKITSRQDIEKITDATILGEVGHSFSKNTLVVTSNSRSIVAEQFRIIRSNLQYIVNNIKNPVILVTSSFSGEGKSFISTNIGAVMALTGKRTIVLEFDIRKPKILTQLNITKQVGLTNYLLGKATLQELPIPVPEQENLYVLACGPIPPNPAEMLLDEKMNDLFVYLRQNFDVVVMDTAPVGMVSDAITLSKFANCTLYIARQGHTYKKQVTIIDSFYREGKLPKVSLILNDVRITSGYGYGGYGYGYGYGSSYFEEEEMPPTFMERWFGWLNGGKKKKKQKKSKTA